MSYDVQSNSEPFLLPKIAKFGGKRSLPWIEYRYTLTPSTGDQSYSASGEIKYQPKLSKTTMKCVYGPASYHACKITATGAGYFDSTSNSVIDRVTEIGQDTISDFRHSNVYMNLALDFTVGLQERRTFWSFFGAKTSTNALNITAAGTSTTGTTMAALKTAWATNLALATAIRAGDYTANAGKDLLGDILWAGVQEVAQPGANISIGDYLADAGFGYYAQVIPGCVIGASQVRLFPLSECNQGYELTFNLESATNAFVGATTAFALSSNRLHLCVIEFNDALTGLMRAAFQNVFTIPTVAIQNYTTQFTNTAANGATFTWQVPVALSNAQGIIFTFRPAANFVATGYTLSQRAKLGCSKYQLQMGNRMLPSNRWVEFNNSAVSSGADAEGFMETCKYFNNTISNNAYVGSVNYTSFNYNCVDAAIATNAGHFCIGYNLQGLFDSQDTEYRSCSQLESNTTFLTVTFTAGADATVYVDCFVQYEQDLLIADGNLTSINKLSAFASGIPG